MRLSAVASLVLASLLVARTSVATEPRARVPPGYRLVTTTAPGLVDAGAITIGLSYVPCVLVAARGVAVDEKSAGYLFIPAVGPVIFGASVESREFKPIATVTGVLVGAAQVAGFWMLMAGFQTKQQLVRIAPVAFADGAWLMASGSF